jgi:hypothetical protein
MLRSREDLAKYSINRNKSDYDDFFIASKEESKVQIDNSYRFYTYIYNFIDKYNFD